MPGGMLLVEVAPIDDRHRSHPNHRVRHSGPSGLTVPTKTASHMSVQSRLPSDRYVKRGDSHIGQAGRAAGPWSGSAGSRARRVGGRTAGQPTLEIGGEVAPVLALQVRALPVPAADRAAAGRRPALAFHRVVV